jgi:UDP-GlcNAc:undecaprenyl-phosphate GlcNAc-1-phosphate transferase
LQSSFGIALPLGLASFTVALIASLALTPVARWGARRIGVVSVPAANRWNARTIPLLGGVAVWASVSIAAVLTQLIDSGVAVLILGGACMAAVGLVDDFVPLKPSTKLTAQIATACLVVALGITLPVSGSAVVDALLTILWIVAVTNAVNLLDNMDGLCAGVVAIAAIGFAWSGVGQPHTAAYAAAIAGACAAFLVYNFKPASIFLGDAGSLFLGCSLAVLSALAGRSGPAGIVPAVAVPAILLLIPLFDSVFVTLSRKLSARSPSVGGRDHTSHRLVALGFSERSAVLLFYGLAAAGSLAAVTLRRAGVTEAPLVLGLLVFALVMLGVHLARVKVYGEGADLVVLRNFSHTPLVLDITYKRRVFEVLLDMALVAFSYYAAYVVRFDRDFAQYYPLLVSSLPIVIASQLVSFFVVGVYRPVWRYFSASDLATYVRGVLLGTVASVLALLYLYRFTGYSRGVFIIYALTLGVLMIGSRASFRILADVASRHGMGDERAVIYGAGDGGAILVRELRNNNRYGFLPVAFLDDAPSKIHRRILGVPVAGGLDQAEAVLRRYRPQVVVVSTEKIPSDRVADLQRIARAHNARMLRLEFRLCELEAVHPRITVGTGH